MLIRVQKYAFIYSLLQMRKSNLKNVSLFPLYWADPVMVLSLINNEPFKITELKA